LWIGLLEGTMQWAHGPTDWNNYNKEHRQVKVDWIDVKCYQKGKE